MPVPSPSARVSAGTSTRLARGRAVATGVGVAGAVLALRAVGALEGATALVVAAVVVLAVPTSRHLSRRILLAGSLTLGWVPVLWWAPVPTAGLGRVTFLLAGGAGAVAAWVARANDPGARARRLVPSVTAVDALPALAAGAAAVLLRGWWSFRSADVALAYLARGWDNSAHFDMVEMIRQHGTTIDTLASPVGTTWKFADYPQAFHVAVAALMELMGRAAPGDVATELVSYTRAVGLLAVVGVAVVVAGLCALPTLRRRPVLAAPLAVLVATGYVLGPGSIALHDGFPNFFFACVLVGAGVLLAAPMRTHVSTVHLAALGGTLVAVAHSWVLLGTLLAPVAVMAVLVVWRQRRRLSRRTWILDLVVVALTVVATARAAAILVGLHATDVLTTQGGIPVPRLAVVFVPPVVACAGWLAVSAWRRPPRPTRATARWLALVPAAGLVTLGALAAVQLHTAGTLSYYFWKYGLAVELLSVVPLAAAAPLLLRPSRPATRPRSAAIAASAVACLVASQAFGLFGPGFSRAPVWHVAPGAERYVQIARQSPATVAASRTLLEIAAHPDAVPSTTLVAIATGPAAIDPISAQQWLLALTGRWTSATNAEATLLARGDDSLATETRTAQGVLDRDPTARLAVSGGDAAALVAALRDPTRAFVVTTP